MTATYISLLLFLSVGQCLCAREKEISLPSSWLKSVAHEKTVKTLADSSVSSDDWEASCQQFSDDIDQAWSLAGKVFETSSLHIVEIGASLYDLINCQPTLLKPFTCIVDSFNEIKAAITPTIADAKECFTEFYNLVPTIINDTKQCLTI